MPRAPKIFPEIEVWPYNSSLLDPGNATCVSTSLFRRTAELEDVLASAIFRRGLEATGQFHVISVGVSFGAELDSIAHIIITRYKHIGRALLTGIDINSRMIAEAQHAKYRADASAGELKRRVPQSSMRVSPLEHPAGSLTLLIDTSGVRRQHDVQFIHADILGPRLDVPEADIIFCNNMLYHMAPERADQTVSSMLGYLMVNGTMSLGTTLHPLTTCMNEDPPVTLYADWRQSLGEKLSTQGVRPILYDTLNGPPFAFRRIE